MEGFRKRALWALVGCIAATGAVLWVVALRAAPTTPWLQAAPGESVVLGLGPVARGDVLTGIVVAALVGGASLMAAWAGRPIWIPSVIAWLVAPPVAARLAGAEFVMPAPLGHWHELLFAGRDLGIDALLAATWAAAVLEMLVITAPAMWATTHRRPSGRALAASAGAVAVVALVDVWLGEGLVAGPLGLVAGSAGLGMAGWLVAVALTLWAVATAGVGGPFAALGLLAGIRRPGVRASAPVLEES